MNGIQYRDVIDSQGNVQSTTEIGPSGKAEAGRFLQKGDQVKFFPNAGPQPEAGWGALADPSVAVARAEASTERANKLQDKLAGWEIGIFNNKDSKGKELTPDAKKSIMQLYNDQSPKYSIREVPEKTVPMGAAGNLLGINEPARTEKIIKKTLPGIPDPAQYEGRVIVDDETGARFKSDGKDWIEVR